MALPEQIRKQSEAVQELYKQLDDENKGTEQAQNEPNVESEPAQPPAETTTETEIVAQSDGSTEQKPSDAKAEDDPNSETYAQKWKTLQGMYNAEVPRLHHQNREMQQRLQQMEQLLASISTQQPTQQPTQQSTQQAQKLVTEKDVEEYGESIDMMRKVTQEELGAVAQRIAQLENALRQVQSNVVPQVQAVAHRQQMSSEQQFWSDLSTAVPNWKEVNDKEAFQSWLLEADPLTGITRQTYLEDAQRSLDAGRVANFFRAWLEITGQAVVAQPNRSTSSSELEKQVTPGRSKSSGAPSSNTSKTYSPADITKFFNDVKQGKYKGREAERDRIEKDIFAAQREGRIVANA
jgi:hypothetical protein